MTTRLTPDVLANVHGDLAAGMEFHPINNRVIAGILNTLDLITVDGYDEDACAAALFAFGSMVQSLPLAVPAGTTAEEVVRFLGTLATSAGQTVHAQTHAVAEEPEFEPSQVTRVVAQEPEAWRDLPRSAPQTVRFDTSQWPPSQRARLARAVAGGGHATADQIEALRQFRAARGLHPFINTLHLTATELNQAVDWWNHRAAMLDMENPT